MFESVPRDNRLASFDQQLNQKRQIKLKTCADVYDYWRTCKRLYRKAPKDGVEFQVEYIDTGLALSDSARAKAPIALALHGAPGSYHDFALLIHHLSQQNVRVIAPNFPEYTATVKTKVLFRHSADEKAAYLRDFLKAINVNTIDLLVSHSSAIFPTLLILLNANNEAINADGKALQTKLQDSVHQQRQDSKQQQQVVKASLIKDSVAATASQLSSTDEIVDNNKGNHLDESVNKFHTSVATAANGGAKHHIKGNEVVNEDDDEDDDDDEDKFEDAKEEVDTNNNTNNRKNNNIDSNYANSINENLVETKESSNTNNNNNNNHHHHHQDVSEINQRLDGSVKTAKKKRDTHKRQGQDVIVKFDQPIEIKAVALFNPAGHRLPKSMKPTWFKCGSVRIYQHKLGRSLFRKLGPAFLTVVGVPVRVDNMDNVMLSATVMRNSKCQRVVQQLEQLSQLKLPTLLVFSENDKLIEKEIFYEMSRFMKLDPKNFDIFNNDGDIELSQSRTEDWIRVMVFKAGGHYAYSNYAKTVNKAVSELLKKVVKEEPSKIASS